MNNNVMEVRFMINLCNFQCSPKHNACNHKPHFAYSMNAPKHGWSHGQMWEDVILR